MTIMSRTLLVDAGNSRCKWAWWSADSIELEVCAGPLSALVALSAPEVVWLACVRGDVTEKALTDAWPQARIIRVTSCEACCGVINGYQEPGRLGVDRWLAMIGARALCKAPFLVVDAGTALTIDLVDEFGQHRGGWIMPGLQLQHQALLKGTALVKADFGGHEAGWGFNTHQAVARGSLAMLAGAVGQGLIQARHTLNSAFTPKVVLTGGDAMLLKDHLNARYILCSSLVINGLALYVGEHMANHTGVE